LCDIVLHGNRFVQLIVWHDVQEWCEGFVLDNRKVVAGFRNRRADVATAFVSRSFELTAFDDEFTPLVLYSLQGIQVHLNRVLIGQRSYVVALVEGVADAQLLVGIGQNVFDLIVDGAVNDQSTSGRATLSTGSNSAKYRRRHHHIKVGVRCDDDGVVSSQLEQRAAQAGTDGSAYRLSHTGATCGADQRNASVSADLLSDVGIAVHHARQGCRNTVGCSHIIPNVLACEGAKRAFLRRLPNTRVAADPCKRCVPRPNSDGEVER